MFDLDVESARQVTDTDQGPLRVLPPSQGRKTGPSFAAQRNPPWDPLSGAPTPWGGALFDPVTAGTAMAGDPLGAQANLPPAQSPLLDAMQGGGQAEQTDTPPLPERERPKGGTPGQADDAPPLPAREQPKSAAPGQADDVPPNRDEQRAQEKPQQKPGATTPRKDPSTDASDGAGGTSEDDAGAHRPGSTPSPAERDHQMRHALPAAMRDMERSFGEDLSGVGISANLPQQARDAGARAMAFGENIAFDPTTVNFDAPEGRRLLAHEVAHVIQQRKGTKYIKREWPDAQGEGKENAVPGEDESLRQQLEQEAEQAAARAVRGAAARIGVGARAPGRLFSGTKKIFDKAKAGAKKAQEQVKELAQAQAPGTETVKSLAAQGGGENGPEGAGGEFGRRLAQLAERSPGLGEKLHRLKGPRKRTRP